MGLRNMIIAGLPPLGCGPSQLTLKNRLIPASRTCLEDEDSGSQDYNKKLIALLPQIEASLPGSKIAYADIYTPLIAMATAPQNYGTFISFHQFFSFFSFSVHASKCVL